MPAGVLPLVIDQGEDWTVQIVWTDNFNEPQKLAAPARLEIKNAVAATQLELSTWDGDPDDPPPGIPQIAISDDIGMIQLHIPRDTTAALVPGEYQYDLFVTTSDDNTYAGSQVIRLLYGTVTVNKRITVMT
jgi:hypothetical protein